MGLLLDQSAFDAAPLQISHPATAALEPISGIVLGVAIFAQRLRVTPEALAGDVAGLIATVTGCRPSRNLRAAPARGAAPNWDQGSSTMRTATFGHHAE